MILVYLTGLLLVLTPGVADWSYGWFHAKITLVLMLAGVHGFMMKYVKVFARDTNRCPKKFFRVLNEVPTVLMIFIVVMVIVKPF
jgi:putative membrane protein